MRPIEGPTKGASGQEFEPERVDFGAAEAGGRLGGVQAGFPRWAATWTLGRMGPAASDLWRGFFAELRGQQRPFFGRDLSRPYPRHYWRSGFTGMTKVNGDPFAGAAADWAVAVDAEGYCTATLEDVPAGLIMGVGDYVGWKWDAEGADADTFDRRALARLIRPAMASDEGVLAMVVEPPPASLVPVDAVAHLDRPACVMKVDLSASRLGPIDRSLAIKSGTIVAYEDLRA